MYYSPNQLLCQFIIVDEQSLAVDGVSGATLTSRAAVSAVAQALESAGANVQSYYISDKPAVKPEGPTEEVDVVIVGAGASGLSAALALKTDNELGFSDSGLNVLVVENNGFVGGDVNFSGGYVASPYGTVLNDATGVSLNPDEFVPMYMESFPEFAELMNQTVFENVFRYSSTALTGLINRGLYLNAADAQEMYGYR